MVQFSANEAILKQGTMDPPEVKGKMYVVCQGAARVHRAADGEADTTLGNFDVGEQFGASSVSEDPTARKPRAGAHCSARRAEPRARPSALGQMS